MPTIRIQIGHLGRASGFTGAHNRELDIREVDLNEEMAQTVKSLVERSPRAGFEWEFFDADTRPGGRTDLFAAFHHDGNKNKKAVRPSVGYSPSNAESRKFAGIFKKFYGAVPGALEFRDDNYSGRALTNYYGLQNAYSGGAPVEVVLEFEFTTNDDRVRWAINNRVALAVAFISSVYEYFGLPPHTTPAHLENQAMTPEETARLESIEADLARATKVNDNQRERIVNQREKIQALEAQAEALETAIARIERKIDNGGMVAATVTADTDVVASILDRIADSLRSE